MLYSNSCICARLCLLFGWHSRAEHENNSSHYGASVILRFPRLWESCVKAVRMVSVLR